MQSDETDAAIGPSPGISERFVCPRFLVSFILTAFIYALLTLIELVLPIPHVIWLRLSGDGTYPVCGLFASLRR